MPIYKKLAFIVRIRGLKWYTASFAKTIETSRYLLIRQKKQFVTGNKAWFGKLVLSNDQKDSHDIALPFVV